MPVNILALQLSLLAENDIAVELGLFVDDTTANTIDVTLVIGFELCTLAT